MCQSEHALGEVPDLIPPACACVGCTGVGYIQWTTQARKYYYLRNSVSHDGHRGGMQITLLLLSTDSWSSASRSCSSCDEGIKLIAACIHEFPERIKQMKTRLHL